MSDVTLVYLITGFLGSGKTTFLNRVIKHFPKDRKLMILMNEFGEIGVDGTLIEGDDIDMMEISKGSIFCVCVKTDFIKGLYELSQTVQPDVLLIESTGVANPTDLKRDLKLPIFHDRFKFTEQFCVIDGAHFLDAYGAYASIEKQITSSSIFIINKTDLSSPETIEKIKEVVRQYHPEPIFHETTYADIRLEALFHFQPASEGLQAKDLSRWERLSQEELDRFLDDLIDNPELEITPPDLLVSGTYRWEGKDLKEIEAFGRLLPDAVVRAKGFVEVDGESWLFSYVLGDWTLEKCTIPREKIQHKNVLVVIAPPDAIAGIEAAAAGKNWTSLGRYNPMSKRGA